MPTERHQLEDVFIHARMFKWIGKKKLQRKGSCNNWYESSHLTNGGELFIIKDFILWTLSVEFNSIRRVHKIKPACLLQWVCL
jgi:hypothetical protein